MAQGGYGAQTLLVHVAMEPDVSGPGLDEFPLNGSLWWVPTWTGRYPGHGSTARTPSEHPTPH